MLTKPKFWLFFVLVMILAFVTRFYKLAQVPHGMTWDEASIGYNGFAILHTRRDETTQKLPISFRSFGDYKAPLAIYVNGLFTFLFGMNLWAVRLPFALSGLVAIASMMLVSRLLFDEIVDKKDKKWWNNPDYLAIGTGLLIMLSPWHYHFSRVGFESGMALSFLLLSLLFFLLFKNRKKSMTLLTAFFSISSVVLAVASMYTYHSTKIVTPLIGLLLFVRYFKAVRRKTLPIVVGLCIGAVLLFPLVKDSVFNKGAERLPQTSIFGLEISNTQKAHKIVTGFLGHFDYQFLVGGKTTTLRHGDGHWGVLYITTLFLIVCTIIFQVTSKNRFRGMVWFSIVWILMSALPAAIGKEIPHSNRFLLSLPAFIWLAVIGFSQLVDKVDSLKINKKIKGSHGKHNQVLNAVIGTIVLTHLLLFMAYSHDYYTKFAADSATDFKDGYLETLSIVRQYEQGLNGKPEFNRILFTDVYGQPYIYTLFVRQTNPIDFHNGALIKYSFRKINFGDLGSKDTIIVAAGDNKLEHQTPDYKIYGSDGEVKFKIFVSK